jgi:membrane protein required for colicin V production
MSLIDLIIIAIVISFTLVSAAWGFIRQVIAVAGLVAGIWLAGLFSTTLANAFGFLNNPQAAKGLAFVVIVLVVSGIASAAASVLYFVAGLLFLGLLDHFLGAVLGFIQGILVCGVLLIGAMAIWPDWSAQQLNGSFLANRMVGFLTALPLLPAPQELKDLIENVRSLVK